MSILKYKLLNTSVDYSDIGSHNIDLAAHELDIVEHLDKNGLGDYHISHIYFHYEVPGIVLIGYDCKLDPEDNRILVNDFKVISVVSPEAFIILKDRPHSFYRLDILTLVRKWLDVCDRIKT